MSLTNLPLSKIRRDGGTQARVEMDRDVAGEYGRLMLSGITLPAPVVFFDGKNYWLADGWHTILGAEGIGLKRLEFDVREGTLRDAILFAASANAQHGLQRTNADKRRAVCMLLEDEQWSKWPNTTIAGHCSVDESMVRRLRKEMAQPDEDEADSVEPSTREVAEDEMVASLSPDERAAWEAMPQEEKEGVRQRSRADALDERLMQIEALASRVRKALGDGEEAQPLCKILQDYVADLRAALGWEKMPVVDVTEDLLQEIKPHVDRMRKLHSELPGSRQADKRLDAFWAKAQKLGE